MGHPGRGANLCEPSGAAYARRVRRALGFVLIALVLVAGAVRLLPDGADRPSGPAPAGPASGAARGADAVARAFREERSGVWLETRGEVIRILADDTKGSRHQRFIVQVPDGPTLLVSHNIDLAPRIDLAEGDVVEARGLYEWNDRGGVLHWTHHDPDGRKTGGWILHRGRRYE